MNESRHRQHQRDLGSANLSKLTRWVTVAALGLTGFLSAALAHALPGRAARSGSSTSVTAPGSVSAPSAGAPALQPPTQAPSPTLAPPQVTSGGS
jgi:hypothetical protein